MTVATEEIYSARNIEAQLEQIPVDSIAASNLNPRKWFAQEPLEELAASIRAHGILEPLVVRPVTPEGARGLETPIVEILDCQPKYEYRYELIAGERRWRAAKLAGLSTVPAVIRHDVSDDGQALQLMLVENLQRADLNPIEEAKGYARLQELGMRQKEIAEQVHKNQPAIAKRLMLLDLPVDVRTRILKGELTAAHGVAISSLKDLQGIPSKLADLAATKSWTARETEEATRELKKIARWPELVEACLDPDDKALKKALGRNVYIEPDLTKRVKLVLDHHAQREERRQKIEELKSQGKTVLDKEPNYQDKAFIELRDYTEEGRMHKALDLKCEAFWVNDEGAPYVRHYCTDPKALRSAMAKARKERPPTDYELNWREQKAKNLARAKERDEAIRRWITGFKGATAQDLELVARRRLDVNWYGCGPHPLSQVAIWLGVPGKSANERLETIVADIKNWRGRDLVLGWLLSEISREVCPEDPAPDWLQPWLEAQGYVDPVAPQEKPETTGESPAPLVEAGPAPPADTTPVQPMRNWCGLSARYAIRHAGGTAFACEYHVNNLLLLLDGAGNPKPLDHAQSGKIICSHEYKAQPAGQSVSSKAEVAS